MPRAKPYVTYTIIAITALVFLLQMGSPSLFGYAEWKGDQLDWPTYYGAQIRDLILQGQLWRFLTPILLHVSVLHIFFNMYAVFVLGPGLERSFGHNRYLLLYLLAGFSGNVTSFLRSTGPSIGASTSIFGLIAAEGIFLYQNRQLFGNRFRSAITNVVVVIILNLAISLAPGIDLWGHVGGLLGGLIFAWFAGPVWELTGTLGMPQLRDKREIRDIVTGAAAVILIFGALAVWGMLTLITQG